MIRSLRLAVVLAWVVGTPARVAASPSSAEDWRFPTLTPAVRTAWMGAQLLGEDTPTSPTVQRLFEQRLAAALEDVPTTATTQSKQPLSDQEGLAMLLAEALADKRLELAPEVRAYWRARAEAIVALPGRRWGAEALAMPALNADNQPGRAQYLDWLFAQFDSDTTPGNGYGASQAALAAMEAGPRVDAARGAGGLARLASRRASHRPPPVATGPARPGPRGGIGHRRRRRHHDHRGLQRNECPRPGHRSRHRGEGADHAGGLG